MSERRPQAAADTDGKSADTPLPRDMPDQQIQDGEDPLDVPVLPETPGQEAGAATEDGRGELPDLDESGAGRDKARQAGVHPEHPTPDEQAG
ncbi:hypothetical protein [Streptomyces sp. B1I3]|uniref:hypothetical protein n=1 Tax=Streptomyces sp. B1I3 TaxID=3042264 RepID=UPI002787957D|nr:hypothetical protein [Streptomyces sp. B1I3]MDQ0792441.1 hypothetical protein [Streptomyces sp. B1I3]